MSAEVQRGIVGNVDSKYEYVCGGFIELIQKLLHCGTNHGPSLYSRTQK